MTPDETKVDSETFKLVFFYGLIVDLYFEFDKRCKKSQ